MSIRPISEKARMQKQKRLTMKTKILAIMSVVLLVLMGGLTLVSCGKDSAQADGTLKVGLNAQFPPFESMGGPNGEEYYGFDIDLAFELGNQLNMAIEIVDMDFDGLIPALQSGKVDLCISGMTITPDRQKNVNFSTPYYTATQVVVMSETSAAQYGSIEDLQKGAKIGVVLGYTGEFIANDYFTADQISTYKTGFEAALEVKNGRLDALIIDSAPAENFAQKNNLVVVPMAFEPEYYGIAIKKDNPELLEQVNGALDNILGTTMYDTWIEVHIE